MPNPNPTPTTDTHPEIKTNSLSPAAQLFVWSTRQWLACARTKHCVHKALNPQYKHFSVESAAPLLDELMLLVAMTAKRHVEVRCLCADTLGRDELILLRALRAVQHGDDHLAEEAISHLLGGALKTTFCRVAKNYTQVLREANMSLSGVTYLRLVEPEVSADGHAKAATPTEGEQHV